MLLVACCAVEPKFEGVDIHHISDDSDDYHKRYFVALDYIEEHNLDKESTFIYCPPNHSRIEGTLIPGDFDSFDLVWSECYYCKRYPTVLRSSIEWKKDTVSWRCDVPYSYTDTNIILYDVQLSQGIIKDTLPREELDLLALMDGMDTKAILSYLSLDLLSLLSFVPQSLLHKEALVALGVSYIREGQEGLGVTLIQKHKDPSFTLGYRRDLLQLLCEGTKGNLVQIAKIFNSSFVDTYLSNSDLVVKVDRDRYSKEDIISTICPCIPKEGVHFFSYATLANGDRYGVARVNNYSINNNGSYTCKGALVPVSHNVIQLPNGTFKQLVGHSSLEDMRLFSIGMKLCFSSTLYSGSQRRSVIVYGEIDVHNCIVATCNVLASPTNRDTEKNWLPFVHNGILRYIYSASPLVILECRDNVLHPLLSREEQLLPSGTKGSAGPIDWNDGKLVLYHGSTDSKTKKRCYYNFFVEYDLYWNIVSKSLPFKLDKEPIEFVGCMEKEGNKVKLYYCVDDNESYSCILEPKLIKIS